jgi:cardiolipin synthase
MKNRIFTVPNELTFLRLAFLPFFIIAIKYDRYFLALGILVAGGLSDALDGWLARVPRSDCGQAAVVVVVFRAGA